MSNERSYQNMKKKMYTHTYTHTHTHRSNYLKRLHLQEFEFMFENIKDQGVTIKKKNFEYNYQRINLIIRRKFLILVFSICA